MFKVFEANHFGMNNIENCVAVLTEFSPISHETRHITVLTRDLDSFKVTNRGGKKFTVNIFND